MSIELILFGVVALVLALDFALKGVKKKNVQDDVERIGGEQPKKKRFNLNYILKRKRNILTFILLVMLFKPIVHYFFSPEFVETTSNDKSYIGVNEPTFRLLDGMKVSDTIYFYDYSRKQSLFTINKNDHAYIDDKVFVKNEEKLSTIFYKNGFGWKQGPFENIVGDVVESKKFYYNLVDFLKANSYDGFDNDYFKRIDDGDYSGGRTLINKSIIDNWIIEGKIKEPKPSLNGLITLFQNLSDKDSFNVGLSFKEDRTISFLYMTILNFKYYVTLIEYVKSTENIYTANGERIYFVGVANDEQTFNRYYDNIEKKWITDRYFNGSWEKKFYYYKKTVREASFNFHFQNIFKLKLWLIAVSFASLGVFVLLFSDKIKAR